MWKCESVANTSVANGAISDQSLVTSVSDQTTSQ